MSEEKKKGAGRAVTVLGMILALVAAGVYAAIYASTRYMSWMTVVCLVAGVLLTGLLLAFRQYRFAPTVLFVAVTVGIMFYVYHIYFFISSVVVGIQFSGFPPSFFVGIACFVVALAVSIAAIFVPFGEKQ
ncbi:MAG: hypothetical protein IIZ39_01510 [Blautia sp.]|nr:hypothetical protein [Blautia sp.]